MPKERKLVSREEREREERMCRLRRIKAEVMTWNCLNGEIGKVVKIR